MFKFYKVNGKNGIGSVGMVVAMVIAAAVVGVVMVVGGGVV